MESDRRAFTCVPTATLVRTTTGPVRAGDLRVGDMVASADGHAYEVAHLDSGVEPTFRIALSDGTHADLAASSVLPTRTGKDRRTRRVGRARRVSEVHQLVSGQPVPSGLTVSRSHPLPPGLDPIGTDAAYLSGLFLAAGVSREYRTTGCAQACASGVGFVIEDQMVQDQVIDLSGSLERHAPTCPYPHVLVVSGSLADDVHHLMSITGVDGLRFSARSLPDALTLAPLRTRHAFLQGLLDASGTTGTGHQGRVRFTSSSQTMTAGVADLVRTLGGYAQLKETAGASPSAWLFLPDALPAFRASSRAKYIGQSAAVPARFVDSVTPGPQSEVVRIGLSGTAPGLLVESMVPLAQAER